MTSLSRTKTFLIPELDYLNCTSIPQHFIQRFLFVSMTNDCKCNWHIGKYRYVTLFTVISWDNRGTMQLVNHGSARNTFVVTAIFSSYTVPIVQEQRKPQLYVSSSSVFKHLLSKVILLKMVICFWWYFSFCVRSHWSSLGSFPIIFLFLSNPLHSAPRWLISRCYTLPHHSLCFFTSFMNKNFIPLFEFFQWSSGETLQTREWERTVCWKS